MRENKYNDPAFFEQYSNMARSKYGLSAAGEWHVFRHILPKFENKRVLDLGCGFGWHCEFAAEQGAKRVLGLDISEKMLERARDMTTFSNIEYITMAIEDINFPDSSFDIVLSSLAFHYIKDFEHVAKKIFDILSPGGDFVFSCEHPIFTAEGRQDWICDNGQPTFWPVDNYFDQSMRRTMFLGETVIKYHRTVEGYLVPLLKSGFIITDFAEPEPDPKLIKQNPEYIDELRRPMFLIISAQKPSE